MIDQEIDIYRNKKTGKSWKLQSKHDGVVIIRRGALIQTLDQDDFDVQFEGVA